MKRSDIHTRKHIGFIFCNDWVYKRGYGMKKLLIVIFNIISLILIFPFLPFLFYFFMAIDYFTDNNSPSRKFLRGEIIFLEWLIK